MKTKFAIGCLVQWYEIDIISEYTDSLNDAINFYDGNIIVDCMVVMNQSLEKTNLPDNEFNLIEEKIFSLFRSLPKRDNIIININSTKSLYTIADYRREFNTRLCNVADVLIWGESDMLVPKQTFDVLDKLHQEVSQQTPKYLATFGICKMWDNSWKPLEHDEFTDRPFIDGDTTNWWSLRYSMNKKEMNSFNDKVTDLNVKIITPHKFNGCGLIISSEVIKSGVNIPSSVFFVHEDSAFMFMTQKLLGQIPQYHFSNILIVHNRKHSKKRSYIKGEELIDKTSTGELRKVHNWYMKANQLCEQNYHNLFNTNYKSFTWEDVWK